MGYTQQHADENKQLDQRACELIGESGWTLAQENKEEWPTYTQSVMNPICRQMITEFSQIKPSRVRQHAWHQLTLIRGEQRRKK